MATSYLTTSILNMHFTMFQTYDMPTTMPLDI